MPLPAHPARVSQPTSLHSGGSQSPQCFRDWSSGRERGPWLGVSQLLATVAPLPVVPSVAPLPTMEGLWGGRMWDTLCLLWGQGQGPGEALACSWPQEPPRDLQTHPKTPLLGWGEGAAGMWQGTAGC